MPDRKGMSQRIRDRKCSDLGLRKTHLKTFIGSYFLSLEQLGHPTWCPRTPRSRNNMGESVRKVADPSPVMGHRDFPGMLSKGSFEYVNTGGD